MLPKSFEFVVSGLLVCFLPGCSWLGFGVVVVSFGVWFHWLASNFPCKVPSGLYSYFLALVVDAPYVDLESVALEFGVFGLAVRSPGLIVGVASC